MKNPNKELNAKQEDKTFVYIFVFFVSFLKEFELLFPIIIFTETNTVKDINNTFKKSVIELFVYDIVFGIALKIIECFLTHKIILLLCIFLPIVSLKMIISSFFHSIPFFNDKIIININKGEVLARIMILILGLLLKKDINLFVLIFGRTILIIFLLIAVITFIFIIIYYNKLEELKKKEESSTKIKYEYFSRNFILNYLLFINYSITFSTFPLLKLYFVGEQFCKVFIIGDIIGRYLSSLTEILNETYYRATFFFRLIYFIYIICTFDNEQKSGLIHSFLLGIISGSLTFIGYCIPVRKKNKKEKMSLLHYLKLGKYNIFFN